MAEINNSIALQTQTPDMMKNIGSVLSTIGGAQQVKQGQMDLQERNALRALSQNLDKYKTQDGNLDLNSLVNDATQAAPKLGAQWAAQMAGAHTQAIAVNSGLNTLSEQQRGIIGKTVMSVADQPFEVQQKVINAVVEANPRLNTWGDVSLKHLQAADGTPNAKQAALQIAKGTIGIQEQNALSTPNYINTGGQLRQVSPAASMSGAPSQIDTTLPPTTQTVDEQGNPTYLGGGPGGKGSPVPAGPKLGVVQNVSDLQKDVSAVRQAGDQVPMQRNINKQILQLSRDTKTGPGSQYWQKGLATIGLGNIGDNYQELGKYLEKNAINAMQTMGGPPSDARLSAASAANGSTEFNPGALQAVTKFNDAATSALDKYRQGMDKSVGTDNPNFANAAKFKSEWAKNLDVDVFRVENAIRDHDTMELQKIKNELGSEKMKELAKKRRNLESLSSTGKLP